MKPYKLKPPSLYPLKAEEALSLFMRVDPAKVVAGMRKLHQRRKEKAAPESAAGSRVG